LLKSPETDINRNKNEAESIKSPQTFSPLYVSRSTFIREYKEKNSKKRLTK